MSFRINKLKVIYILLGIPAVGLLLKFIYNFGVYFGSYVRFLTNF